MLQFLARLRGETFRRAVAGRVAEDSTRVARLADHTVKRPRWAGWARLEDASRLPRAWWEFRRAWCINTTSWRRFWNVSKASAARLVIGFELFSFTSAKTFD